MKSFEISHVINDIETSNCAFTYKREHETSLNLFAEPNLLNNLSGHYGALIVRYLLKELNNDENRIFKWRPEHKYRQYQLFTHYNPGCMPHSIPLSHLLSKTLGEVKIRALCKDNYFLKASLGDGSFATNNWDKTADLNEVLSQYSSDVEFESYFLQNRLRLLREFRIHTFERSIIPHLTFRVPSSQENNRHHRAQAFLIQILNRLPIALLSGTLIGWDIALTTAEEYFIIEANFTGFHPEYRKGFQTTGYVDQPDYGSIASAWINLFFKTNFRVFIDNIHASVTAENAFLKDFNYYASFFNTPTYATLVRDLSKSINDAVLYMGQRSICEMHKLLDHFNRVDLALKYYLIIPDKHDQIFKKMLLGVANTVIISETQLFSTKQYEAVTHFSYHRKKQVCCYHVIRKFRLNCYTIL